jgi:hypothetical protein
MAGLDPHPLFDTGYYRARHLAGDDADRNTLMHYWWGAGGRHASPSPLFDPEFFLSNLPYYDEVVEDDGSPLEIFLAASELSDFAPHPTFDAALYRYQLKSSAAKYCTNRRSCTT